MDPFVLKAHLVSDGSIRAESELLSCMVSSGTTFIQDLVRKNVGQKPVSVEEATEKGHLTGVVSAKL
jgi:hypothetical protein